MKDLTPLTACDSDFLRAPPATLQTFHCTLCMCCVKHM